MDTSTGAADQLAPIMYQYAADAAVSASQMQAIQLMQLHVLEVAVCILIIGFVLVAGLSRPRGSV